MQTDLIKLKIKKDSSVGENALRIKNTFIEACQLLDASIFEPLIDDDQYFQDLNKYRFLHSMKDQFDHLKSEGIVRVELLKGQCEMCFRGQSVHEFYVTPNVGRPAFAYNIQEEGGRIKDIFRCNYSTGYGRAVRESMRASETSTMRFNWDFLDGDL